MRNGKTILLVALALVVTLATLPAAAQAKSHTSIKYPKLPEFKVQKPEVYTLDNGLKVFLMEDRELPLIDVTMRIRTGSNYEPADKVGLGGLFAQVQREGGTKSMTGDEIDEYLGLRAASVETGMSGDSGSAAMNSLVENFDDTFAVFADVVRNPVFADDKIDVAKNQTNASIARRNDEVGAITSREIRRAIYGVDSPLGRLTEYETIAAITRDDLVGWHEKYYHPNNIYLGVVGDFDTRMMKAKIEKAFGDWPEGPTFNEPEVPFDRAMKPGVYFIEKDDVTQTKIRLAHLGIQVSDAPDYFAVQVMNEVLGASFWGRLFKQVRTREGLGYDPFGRVGSSFARRGLFQVGISTKNETTAKAVESLKAEIERLISVPVSQEELAQGKESILNSFVFRYDSKEGILNQIMFYDFYGLPSDFLDTYQSKIEAVTAENVATAAKQYVHPSKLTLLVVGKSEEFDKPLETFGEVAVLDISIPPPPDTQPEIVRSAASLAAGAELFSRMVEKLSESVSDELDSIKADYTIALNMGGQQMSFGQEWAMVLPDKVHETVKTPMGEQIIVLNGKQGFMSAGGQIQDLPSAMVEDQMKDLGRELLLLAARGNVDNPELETIAAGSDTVDGTDCEIVAVTFMEAESRLCVASDGKVVRQTYQGKHPMQQTPGMMEVRFSDYAEVAGHLIPHTRVVTFEGQPLATVTLNSIEFNLELDQAMFEKPANN